MEEEIIKILKKYKTKFSEVSDLYFHPDIPDKKLNKAIKNHSLDYGEKILFHSIGSILGFTYNSSIITSKFFGFKLDEGYSCIEWKKIQEVFYHSKQFHIILDAENKDSKLILPEDAALPSYDKNEDSSKDFADMLCEISNQYENKDHKDFRNLENLFSTNQFEKFEQESKLYIENYGKEGDYSFQTHLLRVDFFVNHPNIDKALWDISHCDQIIKSE